MDIGKRCKAMLLSLLLLPGVTHAVDANHADILLSTDLNHMNVIVNPGGSGCPSGQYWDIGQGGCTTEVILRTVSVTQSCACDCGSGATGSCSSQQNGSYQVFGWRLPTAGNELVSYNGPTSWGGCYTTSSSCAAIPADPGTGGGGPPGQPAVGGNLYITGMICSSSDAGYGYLPEVDSTYREQLIALYRSWGSGGRCPETSGYQNWLRFLVTNAAAAGSTPFAYATAWVNTVKPTVDASATANGEKGPGGLIGANSICNDEAVRQLGGTAHAEYVVGSGNICLITSL